MDAFLPNGAFGTAIVWHRFASGNRRLRGRRSTPRLSTSRVSRRLSRATLDQPIENQVDCLRPKPVIAETGKRTSLRRARRLVKARRERAQSRPREGDRNANHVLRNPSGHHDAVGGLFSGTQIGDGVTESLYLTLALDRGRNHRCTFPAHTSLTY